MSISRKTIKLALEALRREFKSLSVDAWVHEIHGATYPEALRASKRRREILAAIAELEQFRTES